MNHLPGGLAPRRAAERPNSAPAVVAGTRTRQPDVAEKFVTLQKEYADLHAALFEAAQVHRRLCAPRLLRYGTFHIANEIFAVRQLPGDFVIAQEMTDGVVFALGDICGKGLAAGMWVTHLAGLVGTHAAANAEPQVIAAGVNRDFCRMSAVPLASLFLGKLDPFTGMLDYCSAGHPPAFLLRADGNMESLSEGGPLVGVVASAEFSQGRVQLRPRDVLVTYSDGILDSSNSEGEEFGYERLKWQIRNGETSSADELLFSLLGAVQDFAGGRPLEDDMSLVVVRRNTTLEK
jgi:serine phosphatase RsbU (regulator of sigma subunit)